MNDLLRAAGGLLERKTADGPRIAVVHRTYYRDRDGTAGDRVLPKGKAEPGESLEQAALREVAEETGWRARVTGPGHAIVYVVDGAIKQVTFFPMVPMVPAEAEGNDAAVGEPDPEEIAEVLWLTPADAVEQLTYDSERQVVRDAYVAET